jgi:hypothetical protein
LGVTRRDQKTMDSKLLYYQHDETYDAIKKKDLDELIDSFNKIHMMWKEEQISEE